MLPDIEAFDVFTSKAAITVGSTAYPDCDVICFPPQFVTPAELSMGVSPSSIVDNRMRLEVRKDQVPAISIGSTISGSMDGRTAKVYQVSDVESSDPQYHHVWVG